MCLYMTRLTVDRFNLLFCLDLVLTPCLILVGWHELWRAWSVCRGDGHGDSGMAPSVSLVSDPNF
jgi:hypothetical protein